MQAEWCWGGRLLALQVPLLFSSEEDLNPMAPLPTVESAFTAEPPPGPPRWGWHRRFLPQLKPVVEEDRIYAAARDGDVTAFERDSGKELWSVDLADLPINADKRSARPPAAWSLATASCSSAPENGVVYAPERGRTGGAVADHGTGEVVASPAVEDGRVVVLTTSGRLVALGYRRGQAAVDPVRRAAALTLRSAGAPVITNGAVLYGRADGEVGIALLSNGQPVRQSRWPTCAVPPELDRMGGRGCRPLIAGDELLCHRLPMAS